MKCHNNVFQKKGFILLVKSLQDYLLAYVFDKDEFAVVGQRTHNKYTLGDEVYVKVKNADLVRKHLDFTMLGSKKEIEK